MLTDRLALPRGILARLLLPLLLGLAASAWGMHVFVLGTVEDFLDRHMREKMQWMNSTVFDICNRQLDDYLLDATQRRTTQAIVQARAMAEIEFLFEAQNLMGEILHPETGPLLVSRLPEQHRELLDIALANAQSVHIGQMDGHRYIFGVQYFEPWDWTLVLIQDAKAYETMLGQVGKSYFRALTLFGFILVLSLVLVHANVHRPLRRIINRLQQDKPPDYRGIAEFTFLSQTITDMMARTRQQESDNRRLQGELFQAKKMEAVGIFAGGIAHEFNNILQALAGQAQSLSTRLASGDPGLNQVANIDGLVLRGRDLVRKILTFSRKMEPELQYLPLDDLIRREAELLEQTLPKTVALRLDLQASGAHALVDPRQFELVLMNLVANAHDAMQDRGEIFISTLLVRLEAQEAGQKKLPTGDHILLMVRDTGTGMAPEIMEHIFDPFFTTKPVGRGTGLGLSTVHGIMKSHGGAVFCCSNVGEGSEFFLYFPVPELSGTGAVLKPPSCRDIHAKQDSTPEQAVDLTGTERILVVDDEKLVREVTAEMFEAYGYTTFTAASGEQALEIHLREKPDLVLLDLGMPGMGGEECLRKLLQRNPKTRVIVASGYIGHPMAANPADFGASRFISKPYRIQEILTAIRRTIDQD